MAYSQFRLTHHPLINFWKPWTKIRHCFSVTVYRHLTLLSVEEDRQLQRQIHPFPKRMQKMDNINYLGSSLGVAKLTWSTLTWQDTPLPKQVKLVQWNHTRGSLRQGFLEFTYSRFSNS